MKGKSWASCTAQYYWSNCGDSPWAGVLESCRVNCLRPVWVAIQHQRCLIFVSFLYELCVMRFVQLLGT